MELARANIRVATITEEVGNIGDAQTAFRQALEVRRELALRDPRDVESRPRDGKLFERYRPVAHASGPAG